MTRGRKKRSSSSSRSSRGRPVTSTVGGTMVVSDGVLGFADRSIAPPGGRMTATVGGLLDQRAAQHGDRPFLWCGDDRRTYREAAAASDRVAAGLAELGVDPGDRVAVISSNRIEMLEVFFGCAKLGAVLVPVNVFLRGEFLRYQLHDCEATTIVLDGPGFDAASELAPELPTLK